MLSDSPSDTMKTGSAMYADHRHVDVIRDLSISETVSQCGCRTTDRTIGWRSESGTDDSGRCSENSATYVDVQQWHCEASSYLATGETLILAYTITATDPVIATATDDVTITFSGSNDRR